MMADGTAPVGPAPAVEPWKLRLVHTISQVATFVMIWWFAAVGTLYATTFQELSMTQLPFLSGVALKMSGVLHEPASLIAAGAAALAVIVAGHFGRIDRALLPLIGVD